MTEHKGRIALAYAKDGHPVFPCYPGTKEPMTKHGVKDATTDPVQIVAWWKATPNANIGIATGFTFDVLDVDDGGEETLMAHEPISVVAESRTPSGGCHILFKRGSVELRNAVKFAPGLDFRTTGGYIIAPGSETADGRKWEWKSKLNGSPLPDCPQWIIDLIKKGSDGENWKPFELPKLIDEGGRNDLLFREGCRLRAESYDADTIYLVLSALNKKRCQPPVPEDEVRSISASVASKKPGKSFDLATLIARPPSEESEPEIATSREFPLTDLGNAERIIDHHGENLRYCHLWNRWLSFKNGVWRIDETGGSQVHQKAEQSIRQMQRDALLIDFHDKRQALAKFSLGCESAKSIGNMISLAKHQPSVPVTPDELDLNPYLLNVSNGTLDLSTGELRSFQRTDLLTKQIPWAYDPSALCPRWIQFLEEVTGGDKDLKRFIWKAVGYTLLGMTSEQVFFFLYGNTGNNGKSVFTNILSELFGEYGAILPPESLMVRIGDAGVPNDLASLKGVRYAIAPETEDGKRFNEGLLKRLTGGDPFVARFMRENFFTIKPMFTLWITGNHKPVIRGTDDAIWRRVRLVPFTVTIPIEQRDRQLMSKLRAEMPGILNWAVAGLKRYLDQGLEAPESVSKAVTEYRDDSDVLGRFLEECTVSGEQLKVKARKLYERYAEWTKTTKEFTYTEKRFSQAMRERGVASAKDRQGMVYEGMDVVEVGGLDHVYRGD